QQRRRKGLGAVRRAAQAHPRRACPRRRARAARGGVMSVGDSPAAMRPLAHSSWPRLVPRLGSRDNLIRLASVAVTLAAWQWYGRGVARVFLSSPPAIVAALPAMVASGELPAALLSSLQSLAAGLAAAIVLGTTLGLAMGRYRTADAAFTMQ